MSRPTRPFLSLLATLLVGLGSVPVSATGIDFEGLAPFNANTTESGTRLYGDYYLQQMFGAHAHLMDSAVAGSLPVADNGTDWYWHHHENPFRIGRTDAAGFDLERFDATDYWEGGGSHSISLTLTGFYVGGGTITHTLATDTLPGFETFILGGAWTNLLYVEFNPVGDELAFDNVVVHPTSAVPDSTRTAAWVAAGVLALLRIRRRTSRQS